MIHHNLDVSVPSLIRTAAAMLAGIGLDLLCDIGVGHQLSRCLSTTRLPATRHRPAGQPA